LTTPRGDAFFLAAPLAFLLAESLAPIPRDPISECPRVRDGPPRRFLRVRGVGADALGCGAECVKDVQACELA
jgi:hypothetical protein